MMDQENLLPVEWRTTNKGLAEIYSTGLEFAFCKLITDEDDKVVSCRQLTTFMLCKDFLHDSVWSAINNRQINIYGFSHKGSGHLNLKATQLLLRCKNFSGQWEEMLKNVLELLHRFEKRLCIDNIGRKTELYLTQKDEETECRFTAVFDGSIVWMRSPVLLSLFSLLIRVGLAYKIKDDESCEDILKNFPCWTKKALSRNDKRYIKEATPGILRLMKEGIVNIFGEKRNPNYSKKVNINRFHDNFGIVNFSKEYPKKEMPSWYTETT